VLVILLQYLINFSTLSDFRHFEKKLHIAESKLEISCNIIDNFRHQYELSLDEIYDLQGEIDELVDGCCQQKHTILSLNSKLSQLQKSENSVNVALVSAFLVWAFPLF
jgi:hypothetical protein